MKRVFTSNSINSFKPILLILFCTKKQTGHPRSWHWREVSAAPAELWQRHWKCLQTLHETETRPPHWPGPTPGGRSYLVGASVVQQDPSSDGSLPAGKYSLLNQLCISYGLVVLTYRAIVDAFIEVAQYRINVFTYSILGCSPHQRPRGSPGIMTGCRVSCWSLRFSTIAAGWKR